MLKIVIKSLKHGLLMKILQKKRIYLLTFSFIVIIVILNQDDGESEQPEPILLQSCHYLEYKNVFPKWVKHREFPPNSIFYVESSCGGGLNSRQACAVASAAKANPYRMVVVLSTSPVTMDRVANSALSIIKKIQNVELVRINIERYAEDTPISQILKEGFFKREDLDLNLGTILKYITMYKYNGIYLDLDVVVTRPFNDLESNWLVKEKSGTISSKFFSFSYDFNGRTLAELASHILKGHLVFPKEQYTWRINSSAIMEELVNIKHNKTDVKILESEYFFPIPFEDKQVYFKPAGIKDWQKKEIYTYHIWDSYTRYYRMTNDSLYAKIAQEYCPMIYNYYGDKFGRW